MLYVAFCSGSPYWPRPRAVAALDPPRPFDTICVRKTLLLCSIWHAPPSSTWRSPSGHTRIADGLRVDLEVSPRSFCISLDRHVYYLEGLSPSPGCCDGQFNQYFLTLKVGG